MSTLLDLFRGSSALYGGNAAFIEDLYERYLVDPESIDVAWRARFDGLRREAANEPATAETPHGPIRDNFRRLAQEPRAHASSRTADCLDPAAAEKQAAVLSLINGYRYRGHQVADIDPIRLREAPRIADLDLEYHNLGPEDMDQVFNTGSLYAPDRLPLREIVGMVRETYCGTVGSEYMHITSTQEKRWIQKRLEGYRARPELDTEGRRWLLTLLTAAEGIEKYLHQRYVGQKRFSLEGGDALIPMLDELIQRAGRQGMQEIVIGMAHRGRLNVLTNIFGKPPADIFDEFEGRVRMDWRQMVGDVKYHMGFATDVETPGGLVHLVLGFNPSHLEIINPVIEGSVRARQRRRGDRTGDQVLPVLIHGDAAFAGQGVVMETLQLSQTRSYGTGGTVHIVINNQIGFTTSHPLDARSTPYCTDVAKMVQAPVFHVNGDDPEAVIFVTRLALDFRNQFHKDVIVDLICYRRLGHNEADEPAVTQPMMYQKIRQHPTPRAVYAERLIAQGLLTHEEEQAMVTSYRDSIEQGVLIARPVLCGLDNISRVDWSFCRGKHWNQDIDTGVSLETLRTLTEAMLRLPEGFELHPRVEKVWEERRKMAQGRSAAQLGLCRESGLCQPARCRPPGAAVGSGRRTRHLRPSSCQDPRSGDGRCLYPAPASGAASGRLHRHRFDPVGRGGARLRIRLRHRRAACTHALGGAVRRLRQRGAGGHRPVHQLGRHQVGAVLRSGDAAAARHGGPGRRALVGASGALPATLRRAQHPGLRADHAGTDVPSAAPSDGASLSHAADRDDAQESAAASARRLLARRADARPVSGADPRDRSHRSGRGRARRLL
jgi:2-oxoglutarate dehydrogenase E1 component